MSIARLRARLKVAGVPLGMSLQFSQQIPGTPLAIRGGDIREERLPGMRRWVDRNTIQKAYEGLADGKDPDQLIQEEADSGSILYPLLGAAAGGIGGYNLAGKLPADWGASPLTSAVVGTLTGGAAGAAYQHFTRDNRARDMHEALLGANRDIQYSPRHTDASALPGNRNDESSAAAVPPRVLSTAAGS